MTIHMHKQADIQHTHIHIQRSLSQQSFTQSLFLRNRISFLQSTIDECVREELCVGHLSQRTRGRGLDLDRGEDGDVLGGGGGDMKGGWIVG